MESGRKFYTNADILAESYARLVDPLDVLGFCLQIAVWEKYQAMNTIGTPAMDDHKYNSEWWESQADEIAKKLNLDNEQADLS